MSAIDKRFGIGGNKPPGMPVPSVSEVRDYLQSQTQDLNDRAAALGAMLKQYLKDTKSIESEEAQAQASDVVAQIKKCARQIEDNREQVKRPWIDGGKAVEAFFGSVSDKLGGTGRVEEMMTAFAKLLEKRKREFAAEQARKAQEEADRLLALAAQSMTSEALDMAEEAAEAAAEASALASSKPANLSRIKSDYGTTSSSREVLVISCPDPSKLDPEYAIFDEDKARRAILAAKKAGETLTIRGVVIKWDSKIGNYAR